MGACSSNSSTPEAIKLNIFLQSLLNHNNDKQFTSPIGSIKDEPQLQVENFNLQIWNQFEALRYVRDDQNQFYNIFAFFALKQIVENNDQDLLQKICRATELIEWQLYLKGKQILKNQKYLKNKFLILIKKVFKENLFELYYSNMQNNFNFFVLCIIFIRNWIFSITEMNTEKIKNQNEKKKILDWDVQFDLADQTLLKDIVENMNMKLNIFDVQTQSFLQFGTAKRENFIIKGQNELYIGHPKGCFQKSGPSAIIYQLYKQTNQARNVAVEQQKFVSEDLNQQELIYEYSMNQAMFSQIKLRGFKRVRGDGNCFYTAFVYQYLLIVLTKFEDSQFQQFLEILQKIDFNLLHETISHFPNEIRKDLKQIFVSFIYEILGKKNQIQSFENEFKNTKSIFYALSIIYAKNLIQYYLENNSEYKVLLGEEAEQQIQQWELETDNIQVLLVILANCLNLNLHFYFIDSDNKQLDLQKYQKDQDNLSLPRQDIYLLFSPGHYCIGLPLENLK
ncbi:unnamed protein product [Paramecium sonneborni]|uniref:OTU domain-containing protein n=1 Tax=Paramecium sonneborni TaxID=65129 RepID=A0A8S1RMP5_9CILI|nr:unnamed protein product [Paramecium sonneborni]